MDAGNACYEIGKRRLVLPWLYGRDTSVQSGVSLLTLLPWVLFGDDIVSKHLVKLMGSQKKQEVIVGHRGVQSYWASPCCCILFYFLSFFFSLLLVMMKVVKFFLPNPKVLCINCHSKLHFFVYIRYFKSLPNAILDV